MFSQYPYMFFNLHYTCVICRTPDVSATYAIPINDRPIQTHVLARSGNMRLYGKVESGTLHNANHNDQICQREST